MKVGAARRGARFARLSIRNKLLAMVLIPLVGVLPLLGAFLLWWSSQALDQLLRTKVRSDLAEIGRASCRERVLLMV